MFLKISERIVSRVKLAHISIRPQLERVTGIEPAQPAWKAGTLPLSYTRAGAFLQRTCHQYNGPKHPLFVAALRLRAIRINGTSRP